MRKSLVENGLLWGSKTLRILQGKMRGLPVLTDSAVFISVLSASTLPLLDGTKSRMLSLLTRTIFTAPRTISDVEQMIPSNNEFPNLRDFEFASYSLKPQNT